MSAAAELNGMHAVEPDKRPVVLVVDDDPTVRLLAAGALEQCGCEAQEAANGAEALRMFSLVHPDLVVLDLDMPELDGFETCRELRRRSDTRYTPVLMLTGREDDGSIGRSFEAGATDFISKPVSWSLLQNRVQYLLRASRIFLELIESRARLSNAQRMARIAYWNWDFARNELHWSKHAGQLLKVEGAYSRTPSIDGLVAPVHPGDRDTVQLRLARAFKGEEDFDMDHRVVLADGSERFVHHLVEVTFDDRGEAIRACGTVHDITERKQVEEQVWRLAHCDPLTGLPNRRLLEDRLRRALRLARERGHSVALLFLDLDRFKRINDTLGHSGADEVLCYVAERLVGCVRRTDWVSRHATRKEATEPPERPEVSRLGGDEFTVVLPEVSDGQDAGIVCRRILAAFKEPFAVDGYDVIVTPSIGISVFPTDGDDADTMLRNADAAMYSAKNSGRGRFVFYSHEMNAMAARRLEMESRLRAAVRENGLELHYQPKVDAQTRHAVGLEALIRWEDLKFGRVSPPEMILVAEESGLIHEVGEWVLRAACGQIARWKQMGLATLPVAVNVSSRQFEPGLTDLVACVLHETGVEPSLLEIEITETAIMQDEAAAAQIIDALRAMGIAISLDDFGTGYSSLTYLRRFPIDRLKIDRSFVQNSPGDAGDSAVVSAIIQMAHSLKLSVVAEGVETEEHESFLREQGCDELQGYLFARPMTGDACTQYLREQRGADPAAAETH